MAHDLARERIDFHRVYRAALAFLKEPESNLRRLELQGTVEMAVETAGPISLPSEYAEEPEHKGLVWFSPQLAEGHRKSAHDAFQAYESKLSEIMRARVDLLEEFEFRTARARLYELATKPLYVALTRVNATSLAPWVKP